jgi:CAI-1 autoinducer synthase
MDKTATDRTQGMPAWFKEHMKEYVVRWQAYDPFPFDQPSDTSNYVVLHENDYLRLSSHPEVVAAKHAADSGSGGALIASAIYAGNTGEHGDFRSLIGECMHAEDVLLTTSGWTANVGLLESLVNPETPVYMDMKAHASLWDGARLGRGNIVPCRHNDVPSMEKRIKRYGKGVICIDSYYSIDGSIADLHGYVEIAERNDCILVVDEAHSFGMVGPNGGGMAVELGLQDRIPFRTVSLSKAVGGNGGFIAGSKEAIWYLKHRARAVIFSTNPSPGTSAGNMAALRILMREPERARRCLEMGALLRERLTALGIHPEESGCQIVSLKFHTDPLAASFYGAMRDRGVLLSVFTEPAVPKDTSLARFSIHCNISRQDIEKVAQAAAECARILGVEFKAPKAAAAQPAPGRT